MSGTSSGVHHKIQWVPLFFFCFRPASHKESETNKSPCLMWVHRMLLLRFGRCAQHMIAFKRLRIPMRNITPVLSVWNPEEERHFYCFMDVCIKIWQPLSSYSFVWLAKPPPPKKNYSLEGNSQQLAVKSLVKVKKIPLLLLWITVLLGSDFSVLPDLLDHMLKKSTKRLLWSEKTIFC